MKSKNQKQPEVTESSAPNIRIFAVDPGIGQTGWASTEFDPQGTPVLQEAGQVVTSSKDPDDVRVRQIYDEIQAKIEKYQPHIVVVEDYNGKPFQAARTGKVIGVISLAASFNGIVYNEVAQSSWKAVVLGGRATKEDVQAYVRKIFGVKGAKGDNHMTDAIAMTMAAYELFVAPAGGGRGVEHQTA